MAKLTLQQIADEYQMSPKTFKKYVQECSIPYTPIGSHMLFNATEVELHLRSLKKKKPENILQFKPGLPKQKKRIKVQTIKSKFADALR